MSAGLLETTRQTHATINKLEIEITNILCNQSNQHKSRIVDNYRVSFCLGNLLEFKSFIQTNFDLYSLKLHIISILSMHCTQLWFKTFNSK